MILTIIYFFLTFLSTHNFHFIILFVKIIFISIFYPSINFSAYFYKFPSLLNLPLAPASPYRNAISSSTLRNLILSHSPYIQWLCTSLQSLSSTVSSIESLGAPSTLKLPLWDKASAEFCFAKSRELLTKPNPACWSSYCSEDFDFDSQDLVKSTEFLENGNHRKSIASCLEFEPKQNGIAKPNNFDYSRENKRLSNSYADGYFDKSKYEEGNQLSYEDELRINELEQNCRKAFLANYPEFHGKDNNRSSGNRLIKETTLNGTHQHKFDLGARPKNEIQPPRQFMGSPRHQPEYRNGHSNGHEHYPYAISNNPIFDEDRVGSDRLQRRKSDADCHQLYQREVAGLESVKNYLDSKKAQQQQTGLNLGFGKLTQNMIQLGKNIAQNTRNFSGIDVASRNGSNHSVPVLQKPNHLDLDPLPNQNGSPTMQRILEPPKLYQNDRKINEIAKNGVLVERLQAFRPRTSSLTETRRAHLKHFRRSFHQTNNDKDSSDDSDSISHSETDIRGRLRMKRRHRRGMRFNFKNQKAAAAAHQNFLHSEVARELSNLELRDKSPTPSSSFLNSLSPPFSTSRNNVTSWPESAPSSSITFTSNSDLDSDSSSEYPEFCNDVLTFPPSPAP